MDNNFYTFFKQNKSFKDLLFHAFICFLPETKKKKKKKSKSNEWDENKITKFF